MLEEPFLTSSQSRKESAQNFRSNLYARVQRVANSLVVLLGKREVWREKTRFIEKNGFFPLIKFNSFSKLKSTSVPQISHHKALRSLYR